MKIYAIKKATANHAVAFLYVFHGKWNTSKILFGAIFVASF
jgi:hypothetical protein